MSDTEMFHGSPGHYQVTLGEGEGVRLGLSI